MTAVEPNTVTCDVDDSGKINPSVFLQTNSEKRCYCGYKCSCFDIETCLTVDPEC